MYLGQNSKIHLLKEEPEYVQDDNLHVRLDFTSNYAEKGSAIYVADNTNNAVLCQGANREINQADCFIQTLRLYKIAKNFVSERHQHIFTINTAHQSGSDFYGGLLDRCNIPQGLSVEVAQFYFQGEKPLDLITTKLSHKLNRLLTIANMQSHILITLLIKSQNRM